MIPVTFNGTTYSIPTLSEVGWGDNVTNYLVDLGNNALTLKTPQTVTNKTVELASGLASAPGLAFANDPSTGIYQPAVGQMIFVASGASQLTIDGAGVHATTQPVNTNTTQVATTAFVLNQAANSNPLMDGAVNHGAASTFSRSDHVHPTDTSRQAALGYVPVHQGGGKSQLGNQVYLGWDGGNLRAQVDSTDLGPLALTSWVGNNFATYTWVNQNFGTAAWVNANFKPIGAYTPNQNVDYNSNGVHFGSLYCAGLVSTNAIWPSYTDGGFAIFDGGTGKIIRFTNDGWEIFWNASDGDLVWYYPGGNWRWFSTSDGFHIMGNVFAANTSDARTKRDVASYTTGLAALLQLRPVSYFYNGLGGTTDSGRQMYGLIAQEAQPYIPEFIHPTEKGPLKEGAQDPHLPDQLSLDHENLIYTAINAIQELASRLVAVEAELAALKTQPTDGGQF